MEQFAQVYQMYWGDSPFQWIFYASILVILVFEKRYTHKMVFGIFPIVMFVGMFNPITAVAVRTFFNRPELYYVRLFSIIPVFYCMAHGLTLLLAKARGCVKLFCVCAAGGLILLTGHCVYMEPWMREAENLQKVPDEVFSVLEAIPRDGDTTCVAFPNPLYQYARQVDGNIIMPYGRELNGIPIPLLDELDKPVPDVRTAMTLAGNSDVDYIVVNKSEEVRASFGDDGYAPVGETEGYYVYPVAQTPRIDRTLNEKRQIISTVALGADGSPAYSNVSVIAGYEYTYDKYGNRIVERYYDNSGQRVTGIEGCYGMRRSYQMHGLAWLPDSIIGLDEDDQPMLVSGRYETRYRYIRKREVVEERYYDLDGQPMNRLDVGYAGVLRQYNKKGSIVAESYFDTSGAAVAGIDGYAGYTREYDADNRLTAERYFDAQGNAVDNAAGFAEWFISYDENGDVVAETFLDRAGKAVDIAGRVMQDAASDLLRQARKESVENSVGLSYIWNQDGSCTVAGSAKGISWNNLIMDNRPFYFLNGKTYRVEYASENVLLRIIFYADTARSNQIGDLATCEDIEFTVPQNCEAVIIRLWVAPGTDVNETVHPRIYVKD